MNKNDNSEKISLLAISLPFINYFVLVLLRDSLGVKISQSGLELLAIFVGIFIFFLPIAGFSLLLTNWMYKSRSNKNLLQAYVLTAISVLFCIWQIVQIL